MTTNIISINDNNLEQINRNLYRYGGRQGRHYRLFARKVINGWLLCPYLQELTDIDVATGEDVYGENRLDFDGILGTVAAPRDYITY